MATYLELLAKANAEDARFGEEHRGNAVVTALLQKAFGPKPVAPKRRNRLLVKAMAPSGLKPVESAASAKHAQAAAKPLPLPAWTPDQTAEAIEDGVRRGKLSGTAAMAALKAIGR